MRISTEFYTQHRNYPEHSESTRTKRYSPVEM